MTACQRPQERPDDTFDPSPAEREPFNMTLSSEDFPPPPSRPWFVRPARFWETDSADWHLDDPAALRAAPLRVTASAGLLMAHEAMLSPRRTVREFGANVRWWFEQDMGRTVDLETACGLRRPGTSLSEVDARATIAVILTRLARSAPWAGMRPLAAAGAIRAAFDRWASSAGLRYAEQVAEPPLPEPGRSFWRITRTGLARPLPNEQRLAELIRADRGE